MRLTDARTGGKIANVNPCDGMDSRPPIRFFKIKVCEIQKKIITLQST
jgi:hypothetical protein